MNLPNMLTICRFLLVPVYVAVFAAGQHVGAFAVLVIAGATDVLDGYIARSRGLVTQVGSMLDPLADKTMMLAVIITLLAAGMIPWQLALILFLRDAAMIVGSAVFHFRGKKTVPANWMGKLTTALYYVVLMFVFFDLPYAIPLLWLVLLLSFGTSIVYIWKFRMLNHMTRHRAS
ncbi:CDP-alcohol phosphatidyltransferase family protein [Xylanibacillus composti]|uniref:Phosphatidylglycerophosphate synthase n=1 Tax=Xylanibacillus composti TaxID=1572762 RepID=A0A8J4M496_9BACL|nr:CDP-alcohol phosphatidyltransferase family protein [Xylanibacillus composti]GIQ70880.1 CDP-diacylglycerol--glycerol-3-phosphate 3-phosphatidyltransferase [Xylanibacillus composti]